MPIQKKIVQVFNAVKKGFFKLKSWILMFDPTRSLKSRLSLWFVLFSMIPLMMIVSYASYLFNQNLNSELSKRLMAFEEGIDLELNDIEEKLREGGARHANDDYLMRLIRSKNQGSLEDQTISIIENFIVDRISYFMPSGALFLTVTPQRISRDPEIVLPEEYVSLPKILLKSLRRDGQIVLKTTHPDIGVSIDSYTLMKSGKQIKGVIKESVLLGRSYYRATKERTGLDLVLLDTKRKILVSSLPPELEKTFQFPSSKFKKLSTLKFPKASYRMLTKPLYDDREKLSGHLGILVSRANAKSTLTEIRILFLLISIAIAIIVFLFSRIASRTVLQPIELLLKATEHKGDESQKVPETQMEEIKTLIKSFNQMQSQLIHSSRMVSLGKLVAGVAHELNNPIGYTHSNMGHLKEYVATLKQLIAFYQQEATQLPKTKKLRLQKKIRTLDSSYVLKDIDKVIASCLDGTQRTKEIVTGLKNFSRMDEAEIKTVDIHEGIHNTLRILSSEFRNRIKVHRQFSTNGKITCYPSQMNQVFMNLLSNASQSIGDKGDIWIKTRASKSHFEISIRDNGKGISQKHIGQIFDPFFTTKKVGSGTGLGLSISYGIIQKHKGKIQVESKLGKGSLFKITLPRIGLKKAS